LLLVGFFIFLEVPQEQLSNEFILDAQVFEVLECTLLIIHEHVALVFAAREAHLRLTIKLTLHDVAEKLAIELLAKCIFKIVLAEKQQNLLILHVIR